MVTFRSNSMRQAQLRQLGISIPNKLKQAVLDEKKMYWSLPAVSLIRIIGCTSQQSIVSSRYPTVCRSQAFWLMPCTAMLLSVENEGVLTIRYYQRLSGAVYWNLNLVWMVPAVHESDCRLCLSD